MATFPTTPKPSYSITRDMEYRTLVSNFENGAEQRRSKWSQGKAQFMLVYSALSTADTDTLYNFYVARKGCYESFAYTDLITNSTFTCRFAEDRMSYEAFANKLRRTGLKLIQVLST